MHRDEQNIDSVEEVDSEVQSLLSFYTSTTPATRHHHTSTTRAWHNYDTSTTPLGAFSPVDVGLLALRSLQLRIL
jgi:hypothetical protein